MHISKCLDKVRIYGEILIVVDVNKTKKGNKLLNNMKPWLSSLSQSAKKTMPIK